MLGKPLFNRNPYYDDGWYGDCDCNYDPESTIFLPNGMLIWINSNLPGFVYVGDQANYDWHNYNGYAPFKITGECALTALASNDAIEGRWHLYICGPMSTEATAEMEKTKMCRQENVTHKWFEHAIKSAKAGYKGHYTRYSSTTKEVEVDGVKMEVELHTVGHNASHEFSIGLLPDGRIVYKSFGECGEGSEGETLYKESIDVLKPGETPSYVGHW